MSLFKAFECIDNEYRIVQKCDIFTKDELSKWKKTRLEFEKQVFKSAQVPLITLTSYLEHMYQYSQSVQNLLKHLKGQRLPEAFLEFVLPKLTTLHETRLTLYGEQDYSLLASYLKFGCHFDAIDEVKMYLYKQFPHNVKMWIFAAKYIIQDDRDIMLAISFLMDALNCNRANEQIYIEIIRIELDAAAKSTRLIYLEKCTNRLMVLLRNLFQEGHSVEYHIQLLGIIVQYSFATALKQAYSEVIKAYIPQTAVVWHSLAQYEILDDSTQIMGKMVNTDSTASLPNTKFLACLQIYKEGFDRIYFPNKPQLWILYIDFLIMINKNLSCEVDKDLKYQSLRSALATACHYVEIDKYLAWIKHLNTDHALQDVRMAVSAYPASPQLWRARMDIESLLDNPEGVNIAFQQGRYIVQERSLPLWEYYISFLVLRCSPQATIESIYEEGIKEHPNIANGLKPKYVEWLAMTKGIGAARDLYLTLADLPPHCKELHLKMLEVEKNRVPNDLDFMDKIYQLAASQFKEDLEIWLKFVKNLRIKTKAKEDL